MSLKRGSITITPGFNVNMRCGYPHISPEPSVQSWFTKENHSVQELATLQGWHKSRKWGWLCGLHHNWKSRRAREARA